MPSLLAPAGSRGKMAGVKHLIWARAACTSAVAITILACIGPRPTGVVREDSPARRVVLEEVGRLPAFSHATVTRDLIFVSGMLGTNPGSTEIVEGGARAQTAQALRNIASILRSEGAGPRDIAKCTVFLADMADYAAMNEAYIPFFEGSPPARSTIAAAGLALGAALEIECIAQRPRDARPRSE